MRIFQHLDELKDSDGVGNDAIGMHTIFNSLGWDSNFITRIPRRGNNLANANFYTLSDSIKMNTNDIHILHYGGQGYPISNFINLAGKKIFRFHNITPADYFKNTTTPEIYASMFRFESLSYLEIATLSIVSDAAWCDSPFNAYTLQSFNFKKTEILPICKKYNMKLHVPYNKKLNGDNAAMIGVCAYLKYKDTELNQFNDYDKIDRNPKYKLV